MNFGCDLRIFSYSEKISGHEGKKVYLGRFPLFGGSLQRNLNTAPGEFLRREPALFRQLTGVSLICFSLLCYRLIIGHLLHLDVSIRVKCIGIHWNPSRKLLKMCVGQIKMSRWHGDTLQTAVSKQCPSDSATLPGTFPLLDLGSNISVWVMCTGALPVLYWRSAFNDKTPE